jgi:hypothetical protein
MVLERQQRRVFVLILAKRPLVDDVRISSVVKNAWGDPGLYECARVASARTGRGMNNQVACLLQARATRRGSHRGPLSNHTGSLG